MTAVAPHFEAPMTSRLKRWCALLYSVPSEIVPGRIGHIPYLVVFRWVMFLSVSFRFLLLQRDYAGVARLEVWTSSALMGLTAIAATVLLAHGTLRRSSQVQIVLITVDVLLISWVYTLTARTQSSFFLFYALPLFTAAEYLGFTGIAVVLFSTWVSLAGV